MVTIGDYNPFINASRNPLAFTLNVVEEAALVNPTVSIYEGVKYNYTIEFQKEIFILFVNLVL